MDSIRCIVLGIADATEDPHLDHAVALAARLGATLHVVHSYHLPDPALYPYVEMSVFGPDARKEVHRGVQQLLEEQIRKLSPSQSVRCRAVPVPAATAVLDMAREVAADLIIVGATRHGPVARAIVGTTAQRVLRRARAPVLVSRAPLEGQRRVLLTTDLSALSAKVHERGIRLASLLTGGEAQNRTVFVVDYAVPLMAPLEPGVLMDVGRRELDAFLEQTGAERAEGKVRVGEPTREIAAEAEAWGADLLVLGTHGRSGASRFLIGSVAEAVIRAVHCNTLVLPAAALIPEAEAEPL
ncbi:MAG TPA: universal stress protein [Longimicrobiales bacterium]|nr:universal stress protein [Longimicrobiales bacterium]